VLILFFLLYFLIFLFTAKENILPALFSLSDVFYIWLTFSSASTLSCPASSTGIKMETAG
jgi:hypothetical protein